LANQTTHQSRVSMEDTDSDVQGAFTISKNKQCTQT